MDGAASPRVETIDDFKVTDSGVLVDGPWLKVRTRTDVSRVTIG